MIFRVSRGYACTRVLNNFKFEGLSEFKEKVMLILFPSSQSEVLERKITRVVQTFCNNSMNISDLKGSAKNRLNSLIDEYNEIQKYFDLNEKEQQEFFSRVKEIKFLEKWRIYFWKEKSLYDYLNRMEIRGQFFTSELYIPKNDL